MTLSIEDSSSANSRSEEIPSENNGDEEENNGSGAIPSDNNDEEKEHFNSHLSSKQSLVARIQDEDECDDEQQQSRKNCGCCRRFPRICSVFVGVLLPLWLLIFISLGLGSWLAVVERPEELRDNNDVMRARTEARVLMTTVVSTTAAIPRICWQLFLEQNEAKVNRTHLAELLAVALSEVEAELENSTSVNETAQTIPVNDDIVLLNTTELYEFMYECGQTAQPFVQRLLNRAMAASEFANRNKLTFNWIRCANVSAKPRVDKDEVMPHFRHEGQEEYFSSMWTAQQEELYEQYLLESPNTTEGRLDAYRRSLRDASGGEDCTVNRVASCWFWFTVMTTMGYGNQAPETAMGRGLVYTLGFVSMLMFGAILARAGVIASVILDNAIARVKAIKKRRHVASAVFWGVFCVLWWLYIAKATRTWKKDRLGEETDFTLGDGYWFAYISTTTVGLGDYYLEPEVLILSDLFTFSFTFLAGFTFLSAFLNALLTLCSREKPTYVEELLDTLKEKED